MGTPSIPETSMVLFSVMIVLTIFIAPTAIVIWLNTNTNIGTKYSRLKYWLWSTAMIVCLIPVSMASMLMEHINTQNLSNITKTTDTVTILLMMIISMLPSYVWINTLANRIRDYGSNPWIALWTVVPLVNIFIGLFYGIAKHKRKEENSQPQKKSLAKAVINHTKDIKCDIKPKVDEYIKKHSITKCSDSTQNIASIDNKIGQEDSTIDDLSEDEIYEKIMIEIENDDKVKSTWAKALAQSGGDMDKANSIYIQMRVEEIKKEKQKQNKLFSKEQLEKEKIMQKSLESFKQNNGIIFTEKIKDNLYRTISKDSPDMYIYIKWNGNNWKIWKFQWISNNRT